MGLNTPASMNASAVTSGAALIPTGRVVGDVGHVDAHSGRDVRAVGAGRKAGRLRSGARSLLGAELHGSGRSHRRGVDAIADRGVVLVASPVERDRRRDPDAAAAVARLAAGAAVALGRAVAALRERPVGLPAGVGVVGCLVLGLIVGLLAAAAAVLLTRAARLSLRLARRLG